MGVDARGAELLFQVITEREERASIALASNASFSEWGQTFTDPRLAAAVVDRLTFRAHIIETGTRQLPAALGPGEEGVAEALIRLFRGTDSPVTLSVHRVGSYLQRADEI